MKDYAAIADRIGLNPLEPGWRPDEEESMPTVLQERHARLCRTARTCYRLRNSLDGQERADMEAVGDVINARAMSISEEWTE